MGVQSGRPRRPAGSAQLGCPDATPSRRSDLHKVVIFRPSGYLYHPSGSSRSAVNGATKPSVIDSRNRYLAEGPAGSRSGTGLGARQRSTKSTSSTRCRRRGSGITLLTRPRPSPKGAHDYKTTRQDAVRGLRNRVRPRLRPATPDTAPTGSSHSSNKSPRHTRRSSHTSSWTTTPPVSTRKPKKTSFTRH